MCRAKKRHQAHDQGCGFEVRPPASAAGGAGAARLWVLRQAAVRRLRYKGFSGSVPPSLRASGIVVGLFCFAVLVDGAHRAAQQIKNHAQVQMSPHLILFSDGSARMQ